MRTIRSGLVGASSLAVSAVTMAEPRRRAHATRDPDERARRQDPGTASRHLCVARSGQESSRQQEELRQARSAVPGAGNGFPEGVPDRGEDPGSGGIGRQRLRTLTKT